MNISNNGLNFGSFYQFSTKDNKKENIHTAYLEFNAFSCHNKIECRWYENPDLHEYNAYVNCPDGCDSIVETILLSRGINYKKRNLDSLSELDNMISRVSLSEAQQKTKLNLVFLNAEKFDKIYSKDPEYYIGSTEHGPEFNSVEEHMNSGVPIEAPNVLIKESEDGPVTLFYEGRHRYCVMRDLGAKSIPVAMSDESLQIAEKYGIADKVVN